MPARLHGRALGLANAKIFLERLFPGVLLIGRFVRENQVAAALTYPAGFPFKPEFEPTKH